MAWLILAVAIVFEVAGTTALKLSAGLTKPIYIAATALAYVISFALFGLAIKTISVGAAYAIWAGVGTAAIVLVGVIWFAEPLTILRVACIGLIVAGVVGLHMLEGKATL